jgi:hypothetical protein
MEYFLVEDTKLFRSGCFPARNRAGLPEGAGAFHDFGAKDTLPLPPPVKGVGF